MNSSGAIFPISRCLRLYSLLPRQPMLPNDLMKNWTYGEIVFQILYDSIYVMDSIFIARQPIVDEAEQVYAYELLFRDISNRPSISDVEALDDLYATSRVAVNTLNQFGINNLLGNRFAFINADEHFISGDVVTMLPKERFIIEILEDVKVDDTLKSRIEELKSAGYRFAIDDVTFDERFFDNFEAIFPFIDILKIDIQLNDVDYVKEMIDWFGRFPHLTYLAEKVETYKHFKAYKEAGCTLFQGYFFAKPELREQKSLDPSKQILIHLTNLLMNESSTIDEIAAAFEQAPKLSLQLLQFLNSAHMGLRSPIKSVHHAIMMLGKIHLLNWLYLLNYASGKIEKLEDSPIVALAYFRSQLLRKFVQMHTGNRELADMAAFMGIVSLAESFFEVPLRNLLEQIEIDTQIKEALLHQKGALYPYFEVVTDVERFDMESCSKHARAIGVSPQAIQQLIIESYVSNIV